MRLLLQPRSHLTKKPPQSAIAAQGTSRKTPFKSGLLAGLIVLITLVAYIPALQGGFIWDDDAYVTQNPTLRSVEGLARIWLEPRSNPQYYPLVFTSFWAEYHLWGLNPVGYHVVNALLHGLAAVALWLLLKCLKVPGALLAAAVFALHPVHVESVAWVTERKNVLSGLFYLGSALCLVRFFGLEQEGAEQPHRFWWYGSGLLLFVCALLSKTVTCTLPAAMVLLLWWKVGRVRRPEALALAPFFVLGLGFGLLTAWLEQHHVGALGSEWDLSFVERFLVAGRALWFYAGKLVWPAVLIFNYPRWQIDAGAWWQYVYPVGVVLVVLVLWVFRERIGRGPLVGVLFFCGTLFPALGFFDVYPFRYSYVADHFQYLASVGLIGLAVGAFTVAASRLSLWPKRVATAMSLVVLLLLAGQTWSQSQVYKDWKTVWTKTLEKNPESAIAHYNLGRLLLGQQKFEEAISHFSKALQLKPSSAEIHNNLGVALAGAGRLNEAARQFAEALRVEPDHAKARRNLERVMGLMGKPLPNSDTGARP
jgi:hypothetical protein